MEHHRSRFAIAAVALLGSAAVAHSLHPSDVGRSGRAGRVVEVTVDAAPAPAAWTDPPRRLRGPEPAELMEASAALLSDHPAVALPSDARMAPRLSSALTAPVADRDAGDDPIGDLIRGLDRGSEG